MAAWCISSYGTRESQNDMNRFESDIFINDYKYKQKQLFGFKQTLIALFCNFNILKDFSNFQSIYRQWNESIITKVTEAWKQVSGLSMY